MRKRNIQVLFRLTREEAQDLKKKVKKTGLSQETFIRQAITGSVLREKPDEDFYKVTRELSAIGNRVNQLAVKANALGFVDAPMLKEEAKKWAEFRLDVREQFLNPKDEDK